MLRLIAAIGISMIGPHVNVALGQPEPPPVVRPQRQPPPPAPAVDDRPHVRDQREHAAEPLLHGPVHEAFAAPTIRESLAALTPPGLPPEPPTEIPPFVAPQGEPGASRWIPGYWGWNSREKEYLWVSGTWRTPPPDMTWIPGYWTKANGGVRWVSGFWMPDDEQELVYLPPPPTPKTEQPTEQPDERHFWVPGNWQFVEDQYRWKPGFWALAREGLLWTPDCYVWSPRGYVFVRGYWDLPLEQRGILFAPLAMAGRSLTRVTPTVIIDVREALAHWFVEPAYRHYCFGNYYDTDGKAGPIVSWFDRAAPGFDGIRIFYTLNEKTWLTSLKAKHDRCHNDAGYRPSLYWRDRGRAETGELAFAITGPKLPAGLIRLESDEVDFGTLSAHYRNILDRRAEFERGAVIVEGRQPVFAEYESFVPPARSNLPPGQAKKVIIPAGPGLLPPGQAKKVMESYGPIFEKAPKYKEKFGNPGKGKGKDK